MFCVNDGVKKEGRVLYVFISKYGLQPNFQ